MPREGILISKPLERISSDQIKQIHSASIKILSDPGLISFNEQASDLFSSKGAEVSVLSAEGQKSWNIKIPEKLVEEALNSAPKTVTLGARNKDNALVMKGDEPRVCFVTGSETNIILDVDFPAYIKKDDPTREITIPEFHTHRGTVADLCQAAHLCEQLDSVDAFIRPVNIQDKDITDENKDVNKFFASFNNTTKHFMAGLSNLDQLDNVLKMAEIIAGGKEAFKENPIFSLITCLVKSPLQFVEDTTDTFIEICKRGIPVVVSSSPQAGTTAPMKEAGIIAQINAEVLAGLTLGQMVNKGTPSIYGSVPVRARMDDLSDSYGAPETSQYNIDCVQLARFYRLPCYSTSGVCDAKMPGMQSTVERLFSDILVTLSGPQYLHCAFGLFDGNSTYSMLQTVIDDAHFAMLKFFLRSPLVNQTELETSMEQMKKVVSTPQKLYISYIRSMLRSGQLSEPYPFEGDRESDDAIKLAYDRLQQLLAQPENYIDRNTVAKVFDEIPGILPRLNPYK